jgi:cytochrome c oxidase cbb3-type subunit 4
MDSSLILTIWTLVVMVLFVGIVIWAWSSKRKKDFNEAANIPFHEDDKPADKTSKENSHG